MDNQLEINREIVNSTLVLKISGRIDSYWSDQLQKAILAEINAGNYNIRLDLAGVNFISSAGIRVFVLIHKQLKGLNGSFSLSEPSDSVRSLIEMVGLKDLFKGRMEVPTRTVIKEAKQEIINFENFSLKIKSKKEGAGFKYRISGNPELINSSGFTEKELQTEKFPTSKLAVGLGAIGNDFEDCRNRFGEFIAVGGAAAYLPTDGTNNPDYAISAGSFIPEMKYLYSLICDGDFSHLIEFEMKQDAAGITIEELIESILKATNYNEAALVIIGETAGLVGATLTKSPLKIENGNSPFSFPEVRENVNFTTERQFSKMLAVVAGAATKGEKGALRGMMRRMSADSDLYSHFHAAVFPFHPLKKDVSSLSEIVHTLFENSSLQSVIHLLNDDRDIVGVGQSEFVRGWCWVGKIS